MQTEKQPKSVFMPLQKSRFNSRSQYCSKMRYQAWQPFSWIGEDFSRFQHLVQSHSFCSCVSVNSAKLLWPSQSIWNPCPNADKGYDILDREKSGQFLSDFPPRLGREDHGVLENIGLPASWLLVSHLPCRIGAGM